MAGLTENSQKIADYKINLYSSELKNFLNLCKPIFQNHNPSIPIGGLIFTPLLDIQGSTTFHTFGLLVEAVGWDNNNPGEFHRPLTQAQCLKIISTDPQINTQNILTNSPNLVQYQLWERVTMAANSVSKMYKITGAWSGGPLHDPAREFDLVYIDLDKVMELAGIAIDALGNYVQLETGNYYTTPPDPALRCIQISRATMDFDYVDFSNPLLPDEKDMIKARTLKFSPFPEPALINVMGRPAVAYQIGIPCPPIWKDGFASMRIASAVSSSVERGYIPAEPTLPPDGIMSTDPGSVPESFGSLLENLKGNRWTQLFFIISLLLLILSTMLVLNQG